MTEARDKVAGEWYYVVDDSHAVSPFDEYVLRIADGHGGFRSVGSINDEDDAKWIANAMNGLRELQATVGVLKSAGNVTDRYRKGYGDGHANALKMIRVGEP